MRDFLIKLCLFSQEDCQLLKDNIYIMLLVTLVSVTMSYIYNKVCEFGEVLGKKLRIKSAFNNSNCKNDNDTKQYK